MVSFHLQHVKPKYCQNPTLFSNPLLFHGITTSLFDNDNEKR